MFHLFFLLIWRNIGRSSRSFSAPPKKKGFFRHFYFSISPFSAFIFCASGFRYMLRRSFFRHIPSKNGIEMYLRLSEQNPTFLPPYLLLTRKENGKTHFFVPSAINSEPCSLSSVSLACTAEIYSQAYRLLCMWGGGSLKILPHIVWGPRLHGFTFLWTKVLYMAT